MMMIYRIIDLLTALLCWVFAYYIRFHLMHHVQIDTNWQVLFIGVANLLLVLLFYSHNHLYTSQRYFSWHREIFAIVKSHLQAVASLVVILYFFYPSGLSRIMISIYVVLVVVFSLIARLTIKAVLIRLRRRGLNLRHVILMGENNSIREYAKQITRTPEFGVKIRGWFDSGGIASDFGIRDLGQPRDIENNPDLVTADAVVMGYGSLSLENQDEAMVLLNKTNIQMWSLPEIEHVFIGYTIESFHGLPMVKLNGSRLTTLEIMLKRGIDIFGASLALIILFPLMFFVGLIVRLSSPGPIFYGQERVSLDGGTFTMWKFRSMRIDAEDKSGAVWTTRNDSRTTGFGSFIRKTSLDELPQFWNILRGSMSLVGPRPERPVFIEKFKEDIPSYMLRHRMKAGLTGWAQVNGWRGNTSLEKRIEFDLYYIQNWSFWLDIKILFLTLLRGFINNNAY